MIKIPNFVKEYLWDVKVNDLDTKKHATFIIERVLEYGDEEAFGWLSKNFKKEKIKEILKKSKRISPKTGAFYALVFDMPKESLLCIQKPFTQKQNRF